MTVGELIERLEAFPPQFPVVLARGGGRDIIAADNCVINLADLTAKQLIPEVEPDDPEDDVVPPGFEDVVVIFGKAGKATL